MEYSAGFIIIHENNYLLILNKKSNEWGFPKGHLEKGETALEAAHRETLEEVGLTINKIKEYEETITYFMGEERKQKTVTYFLGKPQTTNVTIDANEVTTYAWLTYEEALIKIIHQDLKEILRKAQEIISQAQSS